MLEYGWFPVLLVSVVYSKVIQLNEYIYPFFFQIIFPI